MLALEHPQLIYAGSPPPPPPPITRRESTRRSVSSSITVVPPPRPHPSTSHSQHPPPASTFPAASSSLPSAAAQVRHVAPRHPHPSPPPHSPAVFNIHEYPSQDLLRLLAALLKQIADANDALPKSPTSPSSPLPTHATHASLQRYSHSPIWPSLTLASRIALTTSTPSLSFHARNVPTITLESYLLRILKYCPTTNEVFVSLLVYFDRMAKLSKEATGREFIIDNFNIHRLVIAGVTVASKFFSDVFYTNSRYAKVGGLPQAELNQLELHFLLLNDFRLTISPDEMQFYARRLIAHSQGNTLPHPPPSDPPIPTIAAPRRTMGAMDAYGGDGPSTPHMRPTQKLVHQASSASLASACSRATSISEAETESTDGGGDGGSTDDEPTVRPTWSVRGGDDSRDEGEDGATDGEGVDLDDDDDDDGPGDLRMASPFTHPR
ncbi:cyclin-domain-containing protein [Lactarius hengduanensis]|nr:cyclin-domain-containing protein [Lactarius hengduanensis]